MEITVSFNDEAEESFLISHGKYLQQGNNLKNTVNGLKAQGKRFTIMERDGSTPYLDRFYYMNLRPFARITIHNLMRSDLDGFHDHPWPWQTYILKGGYWEHKPEGTFWRGPGYYTSRSADDLHWLELDPKAPDVWTLFLMGPKQKNWNFMCGGKLIPHQEYLDLRQHYNVEEIEQQVQGWAESGLI